MSIIRAACSPGRRTRRNPGQRAEAQCKELKGTLRASRAWTLRVTWRGGGMAPGRLGPLVGHLQEQRVGELLDGVAVAEAIVPQDVAVVPELLDDLSGAVGHGC